MLRGMGFSNNTPIYLASGTLYKEERYLEPLRKMFPLLETKWSLATADELAPIKVHCVTCLVFSLVQTLYPHLFFRAILRGWLLWTTCYACIVKYL